MVLKDPTVVPRLLVYERRVELCIPPIVARLRPECEVKWRCINRSWRFNFDGFTSIDDSEVENIGCLSVWVTLYTGCEGHCEPIAIVCDVVSVDD